MRVTEVLNFQEPQGKRGKTKLEESEVRGLPAIRMRGARMQETKRRLKGVEKEVRSKTGTLSPGNPAYAVHREDACKLTFEKSFRKNPRETGTGSITEQGYFTFR